MSEGARLVWSVHLARRRPRQAVGVMAVIGAAAAAAGYGFQSLLLGLLAALVLIASVSDYLLPLRFSLDSEGAVACGPMHRRSIPWAQVRRVAREDSGVRLSPFRRPSRLDSFRGIYLWFQDNGDEVMAHIAHHVRPEAAGGDDRPPV